MDKGKDHFQKLNIKREAELGPRETRVVKLDAVTAPVVEQFNFGKLHRAGEGSYSATKAKYGAIAATDPERAVRGQKDRRFSLNPLLKEPLSIEEEERRVIDAKVREQLEKMAVVEMAKAREEGYKAGLEKGRQQAFEQFQKEAADRLAQFEAFLGEAETAKQEIFRANERVLMELVCRMSRMVTLKEVSTDREFILRLCRDLLERIGTRENVRVRVNPADLETAQMLKPGLESALGEMRNFSVEASDDVRGGGCVVQTEWNTIDASLETQFKGIYEALMGKAEGASPAAAEGLDEQQKPAD
jgi:flagellar assembly protein FliH